MKTAQKNGKAVSNTGKTPKQISAHEYRNELHYLRHIMEKTNMAPAEIGEQLKRMGKPGQNEKFRKWLETGPRAVTDDEYIPLTLRVEMPAQWWLDLRRIARANGWTLDQAASELLCDGVETFESRKAREAERSGALDKERKESEAKR